MPQISHRGPTSNIALEELLTKLPEEGVPSLSNRCVRASTLLASKSASPQHQLYKPHQSSSGLLSH